MTAPETNEPVPNHPRRRRLAARLGRAFAHITGWMVVGVLALITLLLVGITLYTNTEDFQRRVSKEVVSVLEDATGGRVELKHIKVELWRLAVEVDGLVIHGLEGPGDAPYLSADKILVRVKINNLIEHLLGHSSGSAIGLNLLRVEQPRVHLIVDKDGKTNQPTPKHPTTSSKPIMDTLLDLQAKEVELVDGVALFNDRAIPFNLTARGLAAEVHYIYGTRSAPERYAATVDLSDLRSQMAKEPEAQSHLHLEAEVGRDTAALTKFDFHTGAASDLTASASLSHFASPVWQAKVAGRIELKQLQILAAVDGLDEGTVDLDIGGHSCAVTPVVAQKHGPLWNLRHPKEKAVAPSAKVLPPDPDCQAGYLLVGSAKAHNVAYVNEYVRFHGINGGAQLHITPAELLLTALTGSLPGGGSATGQLKIVNWLGEVPANAPATSPTVAAAATTANKTAQAVGKAAPVTSAPVVPQVQSAHAYLTATVDRIPLRTIMDTTAPKDYGDLGFDTAISGPVDVQWGGPATDISDTVLVDAELRLAPTGVHRKNALSDVPVTGQILGHYDGKREVVEVKKFDLQTVQSTLVASGILGVNIGDPLTALQVDLNVKDFAEYDQLLQTLGLTGNGRKGAAAIPVVLHGSAQFHGTTSGEIAKLDVKGHLQANNFEFKLDPPPPPAPVKPKHFIGVAMQAATTPTPPAPPPVTDVLIDSLVAEAEYTPSGLAVGSSTVKRGSAVLNLAGTFKPRPVMVHHVADYEWDGGSTIDASVKLANAQVLDVLQIAGQQDKLPITGTVEVDAHAAGILTNLTGGGTISLVKGMMFGEPYDSANVALTVKGKAIEAQSVAVTFHGVQIAGSGGYDVGTEHLHGHVQANNVVLSKFVTVQKALPNDDGVLTLVADANGTIEEPGLKASAQLANVTIENEPLGSASMDAHSEGKTVFYTLKSALVGAQVDANGQTELTGNLQTQAKLSFSGLNIATPLALFQPDGVKAKSNISGTLTVSGPAKTPVALVGSAQFDNFEITAQNITLKSAEPLRIGLRNGLATLDQVHITGTDTDMQASGTAQVFGAVDPKTGKPDAKGGKLDVKAAGNISMALAHTFDPDLIASGKVVFSVAAGGKVMDPSLTGKVEFQSVNLAIDGIPNGLSKLNGTLVFNEDRLNVQNLVATTGGGQLKIGGFLTYRNGLYADLTATGDVVRVRYLGLSSTANANLRLQGGPQSALLSGTILITRFGVGADVDFAAFAGAGGVSAPPDPSAASNKIRLDVHVTSSPQLDFQNSYAKLAGTVDLTIRGTVAEPTVLGRIQITDGSATFAGTKYELQRGDVYFTNPVRIDPTIDLDATARVENYDVTVGLHGTATNLKPTYRSEPPLSEADIFNLLALGRTQEEAQLYQEQQVQQGTDPTTSALLGGALNSTVSNRVSKLFGVSSVKIDPAFVGTLGNSSARITVQQQLSRQITLTYATNINYSSQQLIAVQYQLTPDMSIVATRDESGVFSVVYKIRKRYR